MKISELNIKDFLSRNTDAETNSYLILNYGENDTDPSVTYRISLEELSNMIISNHKLLKYASENKNLISRKYASNAYSDTAAVGQYIDTTDRTVLDSAVTAVSYDGTNKKLTSSVRGGTATDIVTVATLKTDMELNNVNNTSDANKPVSTAQQTALDLKMNNTARGAVNGVASLDENGELTLKNVQCIRKGKPTPLQEVHLKCKYGVNEYHSKFCLFGFKYIEVDANIDINHNDFEQIALCTNFEDASTFECSNNLINIFYENTLRSLRSNSIDIPTDCPTRERMGWTGDSQVFFETATFLTDYSAFTRKHLVDVYDRQFKDGRLPQIAPYSAEDWFMNVMNGSVGWADVGILSPYRFYKKYGDIRILENNFEGMRRYADFMISRCGRTKGIYKIYAKNLHLSKENRRL